MFFLNSQHGGKDLNPTSPTMSRLGNSTGKRPKKSPAAAMSARWRLPDLEGPLSYLPSSPAFDAISIPNLRTLAWYDGLHQETNGNEEGARTVGRERRKWRGRATFVAGGLCYRTWKSVPSSVNFVDFQKPLERVGEFGTMKGYFLAQSALENSRFQLPTRSLTRLSPCLLGTRNEETFID
ncbi:hypothetical protein BP00DRAFT_494249 [Aspergillus indologenus CBS 114.80]|uniref:Uncharacterized protein n=1 Tax=Aspergillus indologenus CBS 114.80 TaxID=1450541 RepID=A0A2V5IVY9_9EURO|nr:hypothetical protein BP00DRAFT_494249 [Aspergillus indologenus CBS 114.80]